MIPARTNSIGSIRGGPLRGDVSIRLNRQTDEQFIVNFQLQFLKIGNCSLWPQRPIERILSGGEPAGMSLESLRNAIPEVWARQVWG